MQPDPDSLELAEELRLGYEAYCAGQHEQAIDFLLPLIDSEPNNWEAWFYIAMACFRVGRLPVALSYFEYINENCPNAAMRARAALAQENIRQIQET